MRAQTQLFCCYLCLVSSIFGHANGDAIRVTRSLIEGAWQSSTYVNAEYCFTQSADRIGQWDFIHTGDATDSGYQWLLMKLSRPLRVRSVTLMGRPEVLDRSLDVEVRLAAELPSGFLTPARIGCGGTLSHGQADSLAMCGSTGRDRSNAWTLQCRYTKCDKLTKYILLRKYVLLSSDKIMNFKYMEIDEDPPTILSKSSMAKAWQSSSWRYRSRSSCFWLSSDPGETFQSGSWASADDGFHWFLLQLKQPALIWNVLLQAASGSEEARNAAAAVQVYYSGTLPGELMQKDTCQSEWMASFRPDDFSLCGTTKESGIADGEQLSVSCCSVPAHMRAAAILLRKPARTHANMSFVSLRLRTSEAARFLVCGDGAGRSDDCSEGSSALRLLTDGKTVTVQVRLPCDMQNDHVTMAVKLTNGTSVRPSATHEYNPISSTVYSFSLTGNLWMQGATLNSGYRCSDGTNQAVAETLEFVVPAQSVNLSLNSAPHWLVGNTAEFSFTTDFALPRPTHSCQLIDSSGSAHALPPATETQQERPLTGSASYVRLRSAFILTVIGSYENGSIHCESRLQGTGVTVTRQRTVPLFYFPCRTQFVLPPPSAWQDGATVSLTADSSGGNRLVTSHTCFLQSSEHRNASLQLISTTGRSSTFSVNVTRRWGSAASVVCLVNQSGLIETWTRQLLPTVLYAAASINLSVPAIITEGWPAEFNVSVADGQPPPSVACSVRWNGGNLSVPMSLERTGQFTPHRVMHNGQLTCVMSQRIGSETVYSQSVNAGLNVRYAPNSSWTATEALVVMENETVSVTMTSVGGNPIPVHFCVIRFANGSMILLENGTQLDDAPLVTNFSFVSLRRYDQNMLICFAHQGTFPPQRFQQFWTVYYPATLELSAPDIVDEGDQAEFSLSVSEGQPPPAAACSLAWRSGVTQLPLTANLTGSFSVVRQMMHSAVLTCTVTQSNGSHTVFSTLDRRNLTVHFTTSSSWTAGQPLALKEGEHLSVTLTSVEGNPEPCQQCWLETAAGFKLQLTPHRQNSNGSQLISQFGVPVVRRFNAGQLKCSVRQEGRPDFAQDFSQGIIVFFSASTISWSGQLINGTELQLTVLTDEGNPQPELDCSLKSETVSIDRLTAIPVSKSIGGNSGWSRRVRLLQWFMEPQLEVTVACLVSQFLEHGVRIFGPANNIRVLRADYSVRTTTQRTTRAATSAERASTMRPSTPTESSVGTTGERPPDKNDSLAPAADAASLAPLAADGDCQNCDKARQEAGGLMVLGLTFLAVAFSIGLAAGTYRCLIRSHRRFELVAIPLQVVRQTRQQRCRQQQRPEELQLQPRNSTPNHYDEVI